MDAINPPELHCAAPRQEVLLRVSGESREFPTFLMDAATNGGNWKIDSDDGGSMERTILLRAPASIPYGAVIAATSNAMARGMTTKVTFDREACPPDDELRSKPKLGS